MNKALRTMCAALVVTASMSGAPAVAEGDYVLYGIVQDQAGRPLADIPVRAQQVDAGRKSGFTTTDAGGRYRFSWDSPGVFLVRAADLFTRQVHEQSRFAYVESTTPTQLDFKLFYKIWAEGGLVDVWAPQTVSVELRTWAPSGSLCVTGTDERTGSSFPFLYSGARDDGSFIWTGDLVVEADAVFGHHFVRLSARECEAGTYMIYPGSGFVYWVRGDTEPPSVEITRPTEGRIYAMDEDLITSPDGKTRAAAGSLHVEGRATDNGGIATGRFELYRDGQFVGADEGYTSDGPREVEPDASFFLDLPGTYELVLKVTDLEGNSSTVRRTIAVGL